MPECNLVSEFQDKRGSETSQGEGTARYNWFLWSVQFLGGDVTWGIVHR